MRTSNKILLGLLVAAILLFTTLFGAVRIKYNNGQIVKGTDLAQREPDHEVPLKGDFKRVDIIGLGDIMIIPSNVLKLKKWDQDNNVTCYIQDGVLHIRPKNLTGRDSTRLNTTYEHVELFLPTVDSINVISGNITLKNINDSAVQRTVFNFELNAGSELKIENDGRSENDFFEHLRVNASAGTAIRFYGMATVKQADIILKSAVFEDMGTNFGKLNIQTDSTSQINIQGHNLRKAVITSKE